MKHLLIAAVLLSSCCKKEPVQICYKIESYIVKKIVPARYEVFAVNYPTGKTVTYTTNQLPIIGSVKCF